MLTIALPTELENAITAAATRSGQSLDDYVAAVCVEALTLEIDRARVDSYLSGIKTVSNEQAQSWLADLSRGIRRAEPC